MPAVLWIFACIPAEPVNLRAADTSRTATNAITATQEEPSRLFLENYARAVERLEAGLTRLHARARVRQFRGKDQGPDEWQTLEFFVDGSRLRVDRHYGSERSSAGGVSDGPDSFLVTPDVVAHVIDPSTDLAYAKYLSDKPDSKFERELRVAAWRFLRASYCFSNASIIERLKHGSWTLEHVEPDPANYGWLHVSCRFASRRDDPAWNTQGTADLWLDEGQDFVIRKARSVSNFLAMVLDVGPYVRVGDQGWVPRQYLLRVYDPEAMPADDRASEPHPFRERIEFELLGDADTAEIPASRFTLSALGVSDPRSGRKIWLFLVAAAVMLIVVGVAARKRRTRAPVPPAASGGSSLTRESL